MVDKKIKYAAAAGIIGGLALAIGAAMRQPGAPSGPPIPTESIDSSPFSVVIGGAHVMSRLTVTSSTTAKLTLVGQRYAKGATRTEVVIERGTYSGDQPIFTPSPPNSMVHAVIGRALIKDRPEAGLNEITGSVTACSGVPPPPEIIFEGTKIFSDTGTLQNMGWKRLRKANELRVPENTSFLTFDESLSMISELPGYHPSDCRIVSGVLGCFGDVNYGNDVFVFVKEFNIPIELGNDLDIKTYGDFILVPSNTCRQVWPQEIINFKLSEA